MNEILWGIIVCDVSTGTHFLVPTSATLYHPHYGPSSLFTSSQE